MSYTVPYSFVPGTKARAQEVNANFASILDSFDNIDANKVNLDLSNITSDGIEVIKNNSSIRNIGELIFSPIPITDSNLHLLDGSLIQGNGIYRDFVNYIRRKYNTNSTFNSEIFTQTGNNVISSDGTASGFTMNDYIIVSERLDIGNDFEMYIPFTCFQNTARSEIYRFQNDSTFIGALNQTSNGSVIFNIMDSTNMLGSPVILRNTELIVGDEYIIVIKQKNQTCTYGYIHDGNYTYVGEKTDFPLDVALINRIKIGGGSTVAYGGSINLKDFSIVRNDTIILNGCIICNYFTDETSWQNSVATYGECGKFVYNQGSNTVRLPKIKGLIEFSTSTTETGNLTEAGLPNITGKQNAIRRDGSVNNNGALRSTLTREGVSSGTGGGKAADINFDASWSDPIYGNSDTVQPQTIKYLVYIVVASTPKTNIQVDIDNIATDLNGKLDADFTNISGTNLKNFDGQWVYQCLNVNVNTTISTGKYDVDLSGYLPAGQNKYEVIVNIYGTQNSSSTTSFVILSSGIIPESGTTLSYANFAVSSISKVQGLLTVLPVGQNKIFSYRIGGQNFDTLYIRLYGYRRIGTNS